MSGNDSIHPAHKEVLDQIPAEFHHLVIPTLKKWDTGVQQKFQEIHDSYNDVKPFKKFVENNIDPGYIEQAVILADQLQREPAKVVNQINEAWNLGLVSKEEAAKLVQQPNEDFIPDGDDTVDIFSDPRVKAMQDSLNALQQQFEAEKRTQTEQEELAEFEEYLDGLENDAKTKNLPFNRTFVTALISQGVDGDDAVKQYHQVITGTVSADDVQTNTNGTPSAPPVMGEAGTVGGGTPDGSVDFGGITKNQLNSTIEQMLAQQADSGQG